MASFEGCIQEEATEGYSWTNVAGPMMQELNSPMIQPREQNQVQNNPYMYNFTEL